jgi:hypothetical protein
MQCARVIVLLLPLALTGCGASGGQKTVVQITNKITSLPSGQTYQFTVNVQHDQKKGVTLSLTGAGTLILTTPTATYLAPPSPPSPNSVTVTVAAANGSGVSDSDTFTITPAAGPVVSILPTTLTVTAGGAATTLNIAMTQDDQFDTLTPGVGGSPICGGACGTFGTINGTPGGGAYTVQYVPPASATGQILAPVTVGSSLPNSTMGTTFVTINP